MNNPTAWGNTRACEVLVEVLKEIGSDSLTDDVNFIFNNFFAAMNQVNKIQDGQAFFRQLALEHYQKLATIKLSWAPKVHSLVNNIMMARHRRGSRPACLFKRS